MRTTGIASGGPGWLSLLVLLFIWNTLKFLVNDTITRVVLIHTRLVVRRMRRAYEPETGACDSQPVRA